MRSDSTLAASPVSHLNAFLDLKNGQKDKIWPRYSDVADRAGVSIKTVDRWVFDYNVPWFYLGKTRRLHWESLRKALEREAGRAK